MVSGRVSSRCVSLRKDDEAVDCQRVVKAFRGGGEVYETSNRRCDLDILCVPVAISFVFLHQCSQQAS
jgi:hypothetical protein